MVEDIETVGELTALEMLAATLARLDEEAPDRPPDLDLKAGEFTAADWIKKRKESGERSSNTTVYADLAALVEAGTLERARRYDTRTQRNCQGYWFARGERDDVEE